MTNYQRQYIIDSRRVAHDFMDGELAVCDIVSRDLFDKFGWTLRCGKYLEDPYLEYHCWNLLPDGSILDATADQFGREGISIVKPTDLRFHQYVHNDAYMENIFPDLVNENDLETNHKRVQ